jgi:hypothetical protein
MEQASIDPVDYARGVVYGCLIRDVCDLAVRESARRPAWRRASGPGSEEFMSPRHAAVLGGCVLAYAALIAWSLGWPA